jgi:hypothetical protein
MSIIPIILKKKRMLQGALSNQEPASDWAYEGVLTAGKTDVSFLFEMPEGSAFISGWSSDTEVPFGTFGSITPLPENIVENSYSDGIYIVTIMGAVMQSGLNYRDGIPEDLSIIEIGGVEYSLTWNELGAYEISISENPFVEGQNYTIKIK